ncbi:hypothetical protein B0H13DRAFT_1933324, partial [Mycena leptocephala]
MADGDSDMSTPWDDDDNWIEDRSSRGTTYERGAAGYWTGDANAPTYVYPLGASLSTPPPPFRGLSDARGTPRAAQKKPDNAGQGTAAPLPQLQAAQQQIGRYADSGSTSGSASDYPSHHREETLRLQALSSRSRFRDEPVWGGRRQRYDPRNSRPDYDDREFHDPRPRDPDHDIGDDRSREPRNTRQKNTWLTARPPRREDKPVEDLPPRLFPSPNPRLAPRGPDGHPQATRTLARIAEGFCAPAPDPGYVASEDRRARCAARNTREAPQALRLRDERLGVWRYLLIANLHQALNLIEWMDQGDDSAYELFRFIVQNASAEPGAFRTE